MNRVVVTGRGLVSTLGDSPAALATALENGQDGFVPITLFTPSAPALGGEITNFDPARYLGEGNFRPLDRTGLLATSAAALALADADLDLAARQEREVGLVLGTMFGSLKTIAEFDRRALTAGVIYAKPMDFANSVINAAAGQAAIWHQLPGANATLSGGPAAGLAAIVYGADLVRRGHSQALLAGGADELCFESHLGFERAGQVTPDGAPRPFGAGRNGFLPAEGAALLALEAADAAQARGARVWAELLGWGVRFDPRRGTDPATAEDAGARAIRAALADAQLPAEAIELVASGADGSPAGDAAKAAALAAVFGARFAALPVFTVQGLAGQCLGAGGALQALALVEALHRGTVPGLGANPLDLTLDPALGLAGANQTTRPLTASHGLVHAAGFDGHHVALVLRRPSGEN